MDQLKKHLKILQELGFEEIITDEKIERHSELNTKEKEKLLLKLSEVVKNCKKCDLHKSRTNVVFGEGNVDTRLMFVGEAPGEDEDRQGRPFVGRAGKLLTKLIERAGYRREDFYIANVCKCRPPNNRTPTPEEIEACFPYLEKQIEIIQPKVICLLGATAGRAFLHRQIRITKERGELIRWKDKLLLLTLHPAYVLRNPSAEELLFQDIKRAIEIAYSDEYEF
jgi:DNA polymerase